ncbi:hypothetical protein V3C99_006678 [Haemonchus contortus]
MATPEVEVLCSEDAGDVAPKEVRKHRRRSERTSTGDATSEKGDVGFKSTRCHAPQTGAPKKNNVFKKKFHPDCGKRNVGFTKSHSEEGKQANSNSVREEPVQKVQSNSQNCAPLRKEQQQHPQRRNGTSNQKQSTTARSGGKTFFKQYMNDDEIQAGLVDGTLFKGQIRINQRNFEEAFIDNPSGSEFPDIAVLGMSDRNRALHSDIVALRIKPRCNWVVNEDAYKSWKKDNPKKRPGPSADECEELKIAVKVVEEMVEAASSLDNSTTGSEEELLASAEIAGRVEGSADTNVDLKDECFTDVQVDEMPEPSIDSAGMESCDPSDLIEVAADSGETLTVVSAEKLNLKSAKKRSYKILSDLPLEEWCLPDDCLQKTAEVVGILEEKNSRLAMGRLELALGSQRKWAKFSPSDSRLPRMMIEASQLPKDFFERPQDFGKFLFLARIVEWAQNSIMARGSLEKELGLAGDIDAETEGLLVTNDIDTSEFSEAVIECLPSVPEGGWKIDEVEFANRRDLRDEIIFTIDPKTARDLDDALSISPCDNVDGCGTPGWEIGVHIADVSYFVDENTELDQWASQRATSVYLVQQVIPMLPRLLCEELCSLNAGVDRLTFSVIWKVDDKANIFEEWFGRTIIRSRVKLTYEHALDFIENPDKDFQDTEMPEISDNVTVHQLKEKVLQLNGIAKLLRQRRRESGSLQLNQPKLKFALDDDNKSPIGVSIYEAKDSNHLVEEFMLLANMAVARKIERHFRKTALLRCHPPPKKKVLRDALKLCNTIGFPINGTSSGELSQALAPFRSNSRLSQSINQVLSTVLMKAMELARYFCTGTVSSPTQYHHYALNVPYYTHFTSPIRRYPDIIVHRLLAASLGYCQPSERTVEELKKIADHCNDKKLIAKKVGESSAEMFFAVLVQRIGPMEAKGVVVNVLDLAFDVLLIKYGVVKRIYVKSLDMRREPSFDEASARLTLYWSTDDGPVEQLIQMCTIVDVVLTGEPNSTKFNAVIKAKSKEESPTLVELWREVEPNNVEGNNLDLGTILLEDS